MKEVRFFYTPDVHTSCELPSDEAMHCVKVLRLKEGDEIHLTDGRGRFYRAEIMTVASRRCLFSVLEEWEQPKEWSGHLHLAMAPTKNNDRTEWLAEKATEIGFDELSFLNCQNSERRVIKSERIDKILVSAMKQSHKASKPALNEMMDFKSFLKKEFDGQKFIAHCYDESDIQHGAEAEKPFLLDVLESSKNALVLVGPEGDFSVEEVREALSKGFRSVSLGRSRLRTETAALVAVHLMHIKHML